MQAGTMDGSEPQPRFEQCKVVPIACRVVLQGRKGVEGKMEIIRELNIYELGQGTKRGP